MPSSYSTDLKLELMVTGEKSGEWGDITNTNLKLLQQGVAGYQEVSIAGGIQTTALAMTNAALSNARNAVIKFTGSITGAQTVTIPAGIEKLYVIENGTSGLFTVAFSPVGGSQVTWATTDKGTKLIWCDGTDAVESGIGSAGATTQVQYNNAGKMAGDANLTWVAADGLNIGTEKELRLQDNTGGQYIGMKASTTTVSYTVTWPPAAPTANGQALTATTAGVASWATAGTAWNAISVAGDSPISAVAGNGYILNTAAGVITLTLPGSPSLGDQISFIDYGSAATNNITIGRNGKTIQGASADLTIALDRAASTLVYDGSAGWLLTDN